MFWEQKRKIDSFQFARTWESWVLEMATTMRKGMASSEEIKEASEGGGCSSGSGNVEHSPAAAATDLSPSSSSSSVRSERGATSKYDFVKVEKKKLYDSCVQKWNGNGIFLSGSWLS
jgi:hypothetical protein